MAKRLQEAANRLYEEETSSGASSTGAAGATVGPRSATPPAGPNPMRYSRTPPPTSASSSSLAHYYFQYQHQFNKSNTPPNRGAPALPLNNQVPLTDQQQSRALQQANARRLRSLGISDSEVRSLADLTKDDQVGAF